MTSGGGRGGADAVLLAACEKPLEQAIEHNAVKIEQNGSIASRTDFATHVSSRTDEQNGDTREHLNAGEQNGKALEQAIFLVLLVRAERRFDETSVLKGK